MTQEQDITNNYLINLKEYSDNHPEQKPAFTVWVDNDGIMRLSIAAGIEKKQVRLACAMIGLHGLE